MNRRIDWRTVLWVALVYVLIVGLMTFPDPLRLAQRLVGNSIDNWIFYWNNWWFGKAIQEGRGWFETRYLFYPRETTLVAHSNSVLNSLLALPLERLVGPVAAYNLVFLGGLWIGALGMFLFVHEMTHRTSAGLVAGFVFAFAPYHLTQLLAHPHLGSIHWWPFYALFLSRALRRRWVVNASLASLFAALTLWSGFQLALLLAIWTVPYVAWRLLRRIRPGSENEFSALHPFVVVGLMTAVALVLSAPLILPLVRAWPSLKDQAANFSETTIKQTDLLAYLLPPRRHPLLGSYVVDVYARFIANKVASPYLGYAVVGLALLSVIARQKEAGFWLLVTIFWMVLAAGSVLRLNGMLYPGIPLPYRVVEGLFPISAIRAPDRFNLLVVFSLSVSCGLGAAYLAKKREWTLVPLGLLLFVEFLHVPLPTRSLPPISPFLTQMATAELSYGVVDYPMGYPLAKQWLYYQTIHEKPSVDGHLSRYTPETYDFITSEPLLKALYQETQQPPLFPESMFESEDRYISALGPSLRSLESAGIRYILYHKPFTTFSLENRFRRVLPAVPIYDDEVLAVYDVADPLPRTYDDFPVRLAPGVELASFDARRGEGDRVWRFRTLARLLASRDSSVTCTIQLVGNGGVELEEPVALFDPLAAKGDSWVVGDLTLEETTVRFPEGIASGEYRWALACPGGTPYVRPETVEVATNEVTAYLRNRTVIRYGEAIELQGYRWRTAGPDLEVTLQWRALEAPGTNYKVFVHLLNADGQLVAQYDAVPCGWQCPTGQWKAGEILLDRGTIPVGGLTAGEYRLAVGLYSATTGDRVPARQANGDSYPDAYPILPSVFLITESQ